MARLRSRSPLLSNLFARISERFNGHPLRRRMLLAILLALAFGLFLLPWLVWAAGQAVLGPYAGGSGARFFGDFFSGLARGSAVFWIVALGPALLLALLFLLLSLSREHRP